MKPNALKRSEAGSALARLRKGIRYTAGPKQRASLAVLGQMARLNKAGRQAEAEALYAATWPEKAALRKARKEAGL